MLSVRADYVLSSLQLGNEEQLSDAASAFHMLMRLRGVRQGVFSPNLDLEVPASNQSEQRRGALAEE